jgi:hypothetical protein
MNFLKGDVVRLKSGETGEVIEVWGLARTFARVRTKDWILLVMEDDIAEVVRRRAAK